MADLAQIVIESVDRTGAGVESARGNFSGLAGAVDGLKSKLGLLAGVAGAGMLVGLVHEAMEAHEQINKLSQKTGIAVEDLSQWAYVAKISDVSTETFAKGIKGLNASMVEAADGSSKSAQLFKAMGVDISGGPQKAMEELAGIFAQLPDGETKATLATQIFKKAGQDMIPMLNQGTEGIRQLKDEAARMGLTMSKDTARAAEEFNDNLKKLKAGGGALGITLANELAPSLAQITTNIKEAYVEGGKLHALWVALGGLGSYLFTDDTLSDAQRLRKEIKEQENGIAMLESAMKRAADQGGKMAEIWAGPEKQKRLEEAKQKLAELKQAYEDLGKAQAAKDNAKTEDPRVKSLEEQIKALLGGGGGTDKAKSDLADIDKLLASIFAKANGTDADFGDKSVKLFQAFVTGRISALEFNQAIALLTQQQPFYKKAIDDANKSEEHRLELMKQGREATVAEIAERDALVDGLEEQNATLAIEIAAIGKTRAEREAMLDVLRLQKDLTKALTAEDEEQIRALYRQRQALREQQDAVQANADVFRGTFGSMDRVAQDAFTNILQGGRDTFTRLADTIKSTVLAALYQMTVRPYLIQFAASLTGTPQSTAMQLAGNALGGGGAGGAANLLGSAGSLLGSLGTSALNGIGNFASNIGLTSVGNFFGGATGALQGPTLTGAALGGEAAAAGSGLSSMLAAAGPYVAIAAALYGLYQAFKKPGGAKEGGGFIGSYSGAGSLLSTGDGGSVFGVSSQNSQFAELGGGIAKSFFDTLKALGGSVGSAAFTIGSDQDPRGTAQNRIKNFVDINGQRVYSVMDREVGRDATRLQSELQVESKRALLAALQASSLPDEIAAILNRVSSSGATEAEIDDVISRATAMHVLFGEISLTVSDAADQIKTVYEQLGDQGSALVTFARGMDGSAKSIGDLTTATAQYRAHVTELIAAYQSAQAAIGQTIDATIAGMRFSTLDKQGQYDFLRGEADRLLAGVGGMTDAAQIVETMRQIAQMSNQAFGLLDDGQRKAKLDEFEQGLRKAQEEADKRLDELKQSVADQANQNLADVKAILKEVADQQQQSANTQQTAANTNLAAANTFSVAVGRGLDVRINSAGPTTDYGA